MALPETSIFLADERGHLCRVRNAQRLKQLREEERMLGAFERHHAITVAAGQAALSNVGSAAGATGTAISESIAGTEARAKLRKRSYASTCRTTESTQGASLIGEQGGQSCRSRRTSTSQRDTTAATQMRPGPRGGPSERPRDEQQSTANAKAMASNDANGARALEARTQLTLSPIVKSLHACTSVHAQVHEVSVSILRSCV